jgi:hypothetical protein
MIEYAVYLVGAIVVVFGVVGYLRGWRREAVALAGLVVGWALVIFAGQILVTFVDRAYLMIRYTFSGGFDVGDSDALLRSLRAHPLVDPGNPYPLYAAVFAIILVGVYYVGSRAAAGPGDFVAKMLGVPIGLLNGYLLSYALLQYAAPAAFGRSLEPTAAIVGRYHTPVLALSAGLVAVALIVVLQSRGRGGSSRRSSARARAR